VTGLIALAFIPILWARALRLTRQKLQLQIPVSMREILADRDHLRAEFAVEQRKLEQAMERVRAGKGQDMQELGRRATENYTLSEALAATRAILQEREAEIAALSRGKHEAEGERGALTIALHDTHAYFERRLGDVDALRKAHDRLEATAETQRTTIAGLNTRVMGLEMTIEDGLRARAAQERQMEALKQALALVSAERDGLATRLAESEAAVVAPAQTVEPRGEADPAVTARLEEALARVQSLEAERATATAMAAHSRDREKGIHLRQSLQAEKARGAERSVASKLDVVMAENAALRGALEAARRRTQPEGPASGGDDAALRAAIHEVGLAVATMTRDAKAVTAL
jgi:chromosome segregation ATPase